MVAARSRIVAVVPARAGSARLAGKNLREVGGVALVERAIQHARAAQADLILVTTDDPLVLNMAARMSDATLIQRPPELATADATTDRVVLHAIDAAAIESDALLLLLQPTSPFRSRRLLKDVVACARVNPECLVLTISRAAKLQHWLRCFDASNNVSEFSFECSAVVPNGAVYAFRCGDFLVAQGFDAMSQKGILTDPMHDCDIDQEYELVIANALAVGGFGDDVVDL